ncbi:cation diffusion facilitator family transporter [Paenibacillus sp. WLX2291]|uniref:cation diffusion facilitator family transporter n=1 Tax=Paenibacillus sp. WLX2291 TaxID=3296934 RepID=UPI003983FF41
MENKFIRQQEKVFWTSMLTGLTLAIVKGITGYLAMNKALIGDALYTAAATARQLTDRVFRQDGRRTRRAQAVDVSSGNGSSGIPFANMVMTVLLLLGGLEIGISAIRDIMADEMAEPKPFAIVLVFLAMAVNEGIFRYRYRYVSKLNHTTLTEMVDTHRYSLYCSIVVLAGLLGTIAALELQQDRLYYVQPISALIVSMILWRQGYVLARQSIYGRLVHTMEQQDASDYMETVQRVQGVITVEQLQAQEQEDGVHIQLIIGVNPQITVQAAAEIADYAKNLLLTRFTHVSHVHVQVVPYNGGYPYKSNYDWNRSEGRSGDGMLH